MENDNSTENLENFGEESDIDITHGETNPIIDSITSENFNVTLARRIIFKRTDLSIQTAMLENKGFVALDDRERFAQPTLKIDSFESIAARLKWEIQSSMSEDYYGHWWIEIYKSDSDYSPSNLQSSFGYWPHHGTGSKINSIVGVQGKINNGMVKDWHARDQEIDWDVYAAFHPIVMGKSEEELIQCITNFANSYDKKGKIWAYPGIPFTNRSNCRVFQEEVMEQCGVLEISTRSNAARPEGVIHGKLRDGASGHVHRK